jgi:DNA (cytosine-5)-methyltransferase 1
MGAAGGGRIAGGGVTPRLLDLFCGAGGAAMGYQRAGFDVVGVDNRPQPRYVGERIVWHADALDVLRDLLAGRITAAGRLSDFAAIHASPRCQLDCAYRRRGDGVGEGYADLIALTRELLGATGLPYVIENVEGARHKLRNPIRLCGSSFGLDVRRHRLFESNVPMLAPPCDHSWQTPRFPQATNRENLRSTVEVGVWRIPLDVQQRAMGIDWMTLPEFSEAIPPAYTEHVGHQLMEHVLAASAADALEERRAA